MREIPENLRHPHYCPYCFVNHILPARAKYLETMERAKKVTVFDKPRRRQPHYSAYSKSKLIVEACEDKSVTLMRLAYLAAEQGYNAVTRVNIRYEKVRDTGGYQTTLWSGTGFAATIDGKESGL